jgi:hypothetical protein
VTVSEIAASQSHFNDLCALIDEPKPLDVDPTGERYAFEKHLFKLDGRPGRADVWKKGCFAWEYKRVGRYKSLAAAYGQLKEYSDALENPPLLIVCDISEIQIHTNFTSTVKVVHVIKLIDLNDPGKRRLLKNAFTNPYLLKPETTREQATNDAAREVAFIARKLRDAGQEPEHVAHFLNKLVFCMFAEDIGLLPNYLFSELLEQARDHPENFKGMAVTLFRAMQNQGSFFGTQRIPWFNGGLFADAEVLPLSNTQIQDLYKVALLDWSAIEPPIFGTLFERGLDPEKRTQLASLLGERKGGGVGIHYTDPDKIMKIVEPVVLRPLRAEWDAVKGNIQAEFAKKAEATNLSARTRYENNARQLYAEFLDRLGAYRVLDPACGSGNFLYVALLRLKDFEAEVLHEAEALGLPREFPKIGPEAVMGIEINPYAAELARLVVWIGEIQWQLKTGYNFKREPILRPLNQIECRDALINPDGTEAVWPKVDSIIGNPPFLGNKRMIRELGGLYTESLRNKFSARISGGVDLVAYWFLKSWEMINEGSAQRTGLVSTNSIRAGSNRTVLARITDLGRIFDAWEDEPWIVNGAAVRVSLVCYDKKKEGSTFLNGTSVDLINANLTAAGIDLTKSKTLLENKGCSFVGVILNGEFEVDGSMARRWLLQSQNDDGSSNKDVLRPTLNGDDFNGNRPDKWVVDFGTSMSEMDAESFRAPFAYIEQQVKPFRFRQNAEGNFEVRAKSEREIWWRHARARPAMREALKELSGYIATPMVSSYRTFEILDASILPDQKLVVFSREDSCFLGVLHSRFHEYWTVKTCSWIGAGNDVTYSNQAVFLTFPFPEGLTPNISATEYAADPRAIAIADAAKALNDAREAWLNPPELVKRVPEVVPGYPDRILPINPEAADILKNRTLTKLYNERPQWLDDLHKTLDAAVARAYGWPEDISDDDALARLFALNQERAAAGR